MLVQRKKMVGERWYKGGKIAKLKRSAVFSKFFVLLLGITWKIRQRDIDAAKSGGESFTWSLADESAFSCKYTLYVGYGLKDVPQACQVPLHFRFSLIARDRMQVRYQETCELGRLHVTCAEVAMVTKHWHYSGNTTVCLGNEEQRRYLSQYGQLRTREDNKTWKQFRQPWLSAII